MTRIKNAGIIPGVLPLAEELRKSGLLGRFLLAALQLLQLVKHSALWRRLCGTGRRSCRLVECRLRRARIARDNGEQQACREKGRGQNGRGASEQIGLPSPRHEAAETTRATPAEPAQRALLGPLEQNHRDKRNDDQEMNNNKNLLHRQTFNRVRNSGVGLARTQGGIKARFFRLNDKPPQCPFYQSLLQVG